VLLSLHVCENYVSLCVFATYGQKAVSSGVLIEQQRGTRYKFSCGCFLPVSEKCHVVVSSCIGGGMICSSTVFT
jgi:hypothetical protein